MMAPAALLSAPFLCAAAILALRHRRKSALAALALAIVLPLGFIARHVRQAARQQTEIRGLTRQLDRQIQRTAASNTAVGAVRE